MGKRRRTIKNDSAYSNLCEQKGRGDERQLDVAIRIDYIALHAQSEVAVGDMNNVVRSGVIRDLFAETIGANGAMMRGRMRRCGTGSCWGKGDGAAILAAAGGITYLTSC